MVFRSFYLCAALLLLSVSAAKADAGTSKCPNGTMKVFVAPFVSHAKAKSLSALSLGTAAYVSEVLENDPCIVPIVGDAYVLTEAQAKLAASKDGAGDGSIMAAANKLARESHATHFLVGGFSGQVWDWSVDASLCLVNQESDIGGNRCVDGHSHGTLVETVSYPNGKTGQLQSAAHLYGLFGSAIVIALAKARTVGGALPQVTTMDALVKPAAHGSKELYPELLLARAYVRLFQYELPRKRMFAAAKTWKQKAALLKMWRLENSKYTAMGLAASAVRNDPTYVQAQRFYAALAEQSPTLKNPTSMARIHYEAALASDSRDYRTLMAVGALELGDGHPEVARGYFARAGKVRPANAEPLHQLGKAFLAYGQTTNAIEAFQFARTIDPTRSDSRKELALLYAQSKRYADAAKEYREVVRNAPSDIDARFALAASLRAAHAFDDRGAINAYLAICELRPLSATSCATALKFAGDVRQEMIAAGSFKGDIPEVVMGEYRDSLRLNPNDRRVRAILSGAKDIPLGGKSLRDAINEAADVSAQLENRHARYQVALNDAVADLRLNGEEGCKDGHGASSALLANSEGKKHGVLLARLAAISNAVQAAFRAGEDAALTPDEKQRGSTAFAALRTAANDAREMRAQYARGFLPLYSRNKCASYDGPLTEATFDAVIARNDVRTIDPPKVPPTQSAPMYFSPEIPSESAFGVSITIDNRDGATDCAVSLADPDARSDGLEWKPLGTVEAGASTEMPVLIGLYRVCIVPKGAKCGDVDVERIAYLHEGWEMKIRANR